MMDNIFRNNFIYFVWNSIVRISFNATFWCNVRVTFGHFWYKSCAHSCTDRKASKFLFWKYFWKVLQVPSDKLMTQKPILFGPIKKLIFSLKLKKRFTFPGMGLWQNASNCDPFEVRVHKLNHNDKLFLKYSTLQQKLDTSATLYQNSSYK